MAQSLWAPNSVSRDGVSVCCAGLRVVAKTLGSRGVKLCWIQVTSTCLAEAAWAQICAGALRPSARHWSGHAIGRSTSRLRPKPRGSRPSITALTRSGARKASDNVIRIDRSVLPSFEAIDSIVSSGSDSSLSSQRCAWRIASMRMVRAPWGMGTGRRASLLAPWMISRLR
jgi:hypothetical protein